ncbi:DUF4198 domain-containing protein [Persephonella sp.]
MRIFLVFILVLFSSVYAHDLWIEKSENGYVLYYGHRYSSHEGKNIIKYNPENIQVVQCVGKDGNLVNLKIKKKYPLVIKEDCAVMYVHIFSGYWTKTPYGTVNKSKQEVNLSINSWLSYESIKRINLWNEKLKKPFTKKIDIIPLNNPFKLNSGDKLRLLITFDGKPVNGVAVAYDGRFRGLTDSNGRINIRIRHKGFQLIEATYRKKIYSEKADEILYTTTLNFEVK